MRRYFGESRFIIIHFGNAASFLYGTGCCLSLAQSATVKIKNIVASADMRRHSDTLRGAQRRRKWGLTGEKTHEQAFCAARVLSSRHIQKNPSFPGHAPGKDTLRAANAATKTRFTGRKKNKRKRILLSSRRSQKGG